MSNACLHFYKFSKEKYLKTKKGTQIYLRSRQNSTSKPWIQSFMPPVCWGNSGPYGGQVSAVSSPPSPSRALRVSWRLPSLGGSQALVTELQTHQGLLLKMHILRSFLGLLIHHPQWWFNFFYIFKRHLFAHCWLRWAFVAMPEFSLVAASGAPPWLRRRLLVAVASRVEHRLWALELSSWGTWA